ncbi:MAG: LysR family transcriptional regulator [Sporomusaceae bacterium]|nr:LysR family transcriptional regulator [Sporomusaceae bacterium]
MIKNLEIFIAVAKNLNFGEAARQLNYSQSTVSEQIKNLETYLGVKVFERIGRKVFLTEQGKQLLPHAERMVRDAKNLKLLFQSESKVGGTLVIGAAETLCTYWLPPLLKEYQKLYPEVQIHIRTGVCTEFPQWLQKNIIDVAFSLYEEYKEPQLREFTLFSGDTILFAAPDHFLAKCSKLTIQDLSGETLLMPEGSSGYPTDLKLLLSKNQVFVNWLEFSSLETIKQCVRNGLGIALLPELALKAELERSELVKLPWQSGIVVKSQMVFHRDKWFSAPLAALEKLVYSQLT